MSVKPIKERKAHSRLMAKHMENTAKFFMQVYRLKPQDFITYAEHRHNPPDNPYDIAIKVRFWRRYENFLSDFQARYETETIPGAYFGITRDKDEYGDPTSPWYREIHVPTEGQTEAQVLRHLYHEMGHLFMKTFMVYNVEVPSWIEEGTAELFQYRGGNGTNAEAARREREGWLVEIVPSPPGFPGAAIPWAEFTQVRNIDNLGFTHEDPLRSSVQYAQAWSVAEFMIADSRRRRAYTAFLDGLKAHAKSTLEDLWGRGRRGRELIDAANDRIYADQYQIFTEAYGRDPRTVEDLWKDWIVKEFEKKAKRNPTGLHYYRGDWHLSFVARVARDQADRDRAYAAAEAAFQAAIDGSDREPLGHVGMGRLALAKGDNQAAGEHFAKAVELGAEGFEAQLYGGYALIRAGRSAEAIEPLTTAAEERSDHFTANLYLGWALTASGEDYEQALIHLERARDLRPQEQGMPSLIAGIAAHKLGEFRDARIHYRRAANNLGIDGIGVLARPLAVLTSFDNAQMEDVELGIQELRNENHPLLPGLNNAFREGIRLRPGFGPDGVPGIIGLTMEEPEAETDGDGAAE